jgi:hypothetical protein
MIEALVDAYGDEHITKNDGAVKAPCRAQVICSGGTPPPVQDCSQPGGAMNVVSLSAERNSSQRPAKTSWKEILVGTYRSITEDRVLAVAAGVTFYGLLAVFPAIDALVSLYGLFADAATIRDHLAQLSGILPGGAIDIVGDQIQRVAAAGQGTLSFSFLVGLAIAIWGANAGVKAMFDAINVGYGAKEERGFFKLNAISLVFTAGMLAFALLALAAVVILPVSIHYLGLDSAAEALLRFGRWPLIWLVIALGLACSIGSARPIHSIQNGAALPHPCSGLPGRFCSLGTQETSEVTTRRMALLAQSSAS